MMTVVRVACCFVYDGRAAAPVANNNANKRHIDFLEAHMSIPCFLAYRPLIQIQR
jgi:hypothetical protein